MRNLSSSILVSLVLLAAAAAFGQQRFTGTVTEVIDGKTAIMETSAGKVKVVLQYIEIPKPGQPMNAVVRDHLAKLVVGQAVEFYPVRIDYDRTIGALYRGGIDISRQMIRDGAARHQNVAASGQKANDAQEYFTDETLAKAEKRGIWAEASAKTTRALRSSWMESPGGNGLDKWNVFLEKTKSHAPAASSTRPVAFGNATKDVEIWPAARTSDPQDDASFPAFYDTARKEGFAATPSVRVDLAGTRTSRRLAFRAVYVYRGEPSAVAENTFILGFLSESDNYDFTGVNNLTFVADKQNLSIGEPRRLFREVPGGVQELLLYKAGRETLAKITAAKTLYIRLARYNGTIDKQIQPSIRQLITLSN